MQAKDSDREPDSEIAKDRGRARSLILGARKAIDVPYGLAVLPESMN
jgi:hypothetical protein